MKTIKLITLLALFISFSSCSDDENNINVLPIESDTVTNLYAPQLGGVDQTTGNFTPIFGEFTKFDFSTGQITTSATEWDIAFRATSIIINGGASLGTIDEPERTGNAAAYIATGTMATVETVDVGSLIQDSVSGYAIDAWYTYAGPPTHLITPTAGRVILVRTRDGKYAKLEILSYYKDAPDVPDAFVDEERYYTFNYVYQPNSSDTSF